MRTAFVALVAAATAAAASVPWPAGNIPRPAVAPIGVNSYDAVKGAYTYNQTVAAAAYMAQGHLPHFDTLVIDGGWYNCKKGPSFDGNGLPVPCPEHYGGRTLKQVAAAVRAAGVQGFGVWTIRGIPREAVEHNLPIAGSGFRARDAARLDRNCSWNSLNYGVRDNDAGRAWYDSLFTMLADANVSFVKMDCLYPSGPGIPYNEDEVRMFAEAMQRGQARTGHALTVSFSPGATVTTGNASEVAAGRWATQYRVTQDFWDVWRRSGGGVYPTDLYSKVDTARQFAGFFGDNGTFADLDMLPIGRLGGHARVGGGVTPVTGPSTPTQFTGDEQQFLAALWLVTRAPLMLGAFLPLEPAAHPADASVLRLFGSESAMRVTRCAAGSRPVEVDAATTTAAGGDAAAWASVPTDCGTTAMAEQRYLAAFNRGDASATVGVAAAELGLSGSNCWCASDVWSGEALPGGPVGASGVFKFPLRPHAAELALVRPSKCGSPCQ